MSHRYKVGQMLELRSAPRHSNRPAGPCEVMSCLPHDKGPVLYRVKSWGESNERVVEEIDLSPSSVVKTVFEDSESVFTIAVNKR
ncbi:hypothetical protein GGR20_001072 [Devosia subaequoris]|uniref:Uncharacterized protein n=1 Tax=Devosia subaequoris TaxID=395930 RepID=A0A7W6IKR1_9HYPH|nr:hypothetical protein [Devosia subaequoris]MBB4051436.1 hypothetical protein [Devosia subaequoris]MCP1209030.1 hypothetical protein [Devosia subaequoris]